MKRIAIILATIIAVTTVSASAATPAKVKATATTNSITATWSKSNASYYQVYVNGKRYKSTKATKIVINNRKAGTTYKIKVRPVKRWRAKKYYNRRWTWKKPARYTRTKYAYRYAYGKFAYKTVTTAKKSQSISCKASYNLSVDDDLYLDATAKTALSYKSSNPNVVYVSANGYVYAMSEGTATVTVTAKATSTYKGAKKTVTVNVGDVTADEAVEEQDFGDIVVADDRAEYMLELTFCNITYCEGFHTPLYTEYGYNRFSGTIERGNKCQFCGRIEHNHTDWIYVEGGKIELEKTYVTMYTNQNVVFHADTIENYREELGSFMPIGY